MRLYKFGNREIRSFRMRERMLRIKALFENTASTACFIMSDAIQPENRTELREPLTTHNLSLKMLSKKVINLWMANSQWGSLKELLKGNVVLVEALNKQTGEKLQFDATKLQFVMSRESDIFSVRLFLENQNSYRKEKMQVFLNRLGEGQLFTNKLITEGFTAPLNKGAFVVETIVVKPNYISQI